MTDYRPLLARAIAALDPNTGEARRAVYDRARTALVNQLRGMNPPLAEADITRQRLALEDSIRKVESEATAAPVSAPSAPPPPPVARDPRPPRGEPMPRSEPQPRSEPPAPRGAARPPVADPGFDPREPYPQEPYADEPPPRDPRGPRSNGRPDPRGPAARPEPSLRPRGGRGRSPADYARDDARRASRTKFVVFGLVFVLLAIAGTVGYLHRDRVMSIVLGKGAQTTQNNETPAQQPNKATDRLPQQQSQQQAPAPLAPTNQPAGAAQRAFLFEENPGSQQFTSITGNATWRTETVNPGPGKSPELGIRIDVDIPERKMQVVITIRRNPDASLPATHYVEVQFVGNDAYGGVAQVPVVRMKNHEAAQGIPLAGVSIRVMQGFFLIGLSAADTERDRNIQVLRTLSWVDIPFIYNNGRRAVVTFEKGPAGDKAMAEAFAAWAN